MQSHKQGASHGNQQRTSAQPPGKGLFRLGMDNVQHLLCSETTCYFSPMPINVKKTGCRVSIYIGNKYTSQDCRANICNPLPETPASRLCIPVTQMQAPDVPQAEPACWGKEMVKKEVQIAGRITT